VRLHREEDKMKEARKQKEQRRKRGKVREANLRGARGQQ
jgi:hypothetical protein